MPKTQTEQHLSYILDVFSGADGGVDFIKFKYILMELDKLDDYRAKILVGIVKEFALLIKKCIRMYDAQVSKG